MNRICHRLILPIRVPAGLCAGESLDANHRVIARDGCDRAVLRGSAIAGALRHAWSRYWLNAGPDDGRVAAWFGAAQGDAPADRGPASRLRVDDAVLDSGDADVRTRTHNQHDRHRGAALDGGLFSLESAAPGTMTRLRLIVAAGPDEDAAARELLERLAGLFTQGLTLGGGVARGVGMAELHGTPAYRRFDLSELDEHARWLEDVRAWRLGESMDAPDAESGFEPQVPPGRLRVDLVLQVPRGQDLLVGDGQGLEAESEPQRVMHRDGLRWCLPGSTLKGLFRGWVARLAARGSDDGSVDDRVERYLVRRGAGQQTTGAMTAYGDVDDETRRTLQRDPDRVTCPVMRLFGSGYARGRVVILDALTDDADEQPRMHVAVDRVSGGVNEGLLFDCRVLTRARFPVTVLVDDPSDEEVRWLAGCIRALDRGLIRVGSSKAAGRLALAQPPEARGPHAEHMTAIRPTGGPL